MHWVSRLRSHMVSVVITAYNVEAWIEQCVLSVCKQSLDDIEIIVVEDCSTDGTRDILARIREPRLKVLYNNTNVGAGASRKRGIEARMQVSVSLSWLSIRLLPSVATRALPSVMATMVSSVVTSSSTFSTSSRRVFPTRRSTPSRQCSVRRRMAV